MAGLVVTIPDPLGQLIRQVAKANGMTPSYYIKLVMREEATKDAKDAGILEESK